jgi:hypothetical protein
MSLDLATPGTATGLTYVEGSTHLLRAFSGGMLGPLPDGIIGGGVQLAELGPPVGCFQCFTAYQRLIEFRARVA